MYDKNIGLTVGFDCISVGLYPHGCEINFNKFLRFIMHILI